MIRFADDIDPQRRAVVAGGREVRLSAVGWRLFAILYQADLEDGEPRSRAQLAALLHTNDGRRVYIGPHIKRLRDDLRGSRFAIEGDHDRGWRLIVRAPPSEGGTPPAPARRRRAQAAHMPAATRRDQAAEHYAAILATALLDLFRLLRG